VRDYSPTIISSDIFTTPVTHQLITLHNGNAEVHAYIFEQSISPKCIQNREIKRREMARSVLELFTMVPIVSVEARDTHGIIQTDQRIRRTHRGRIGNWRGGNGRYKPSITTVDRVGSKSHTYSQSMQVGERIVDRRIRVHLTQPIVSRSKTFLGTGDDGWIYLRSLGANENSQSDSVSATNWR
jgi:hypothetical protein